MRVALASPFACPVRRSIMEGMSHPYAATLELLRLSIERAPAFFPEERRAMMRAEVERLVADAATPATQIEEKIALFGREMWPYRRVFAELHDRQGRVREDQYLRERLAKSGFAEKYLNFLAKGGKVEDVRQGGEFEVYFSPDERAQVVAAKLAAHDRVEAEINTLCAGDEQGECAALFERFLREQREIETELQVLAGLAHRSEKWAAEILGKVRTFAHGWSGLERDVSLEDVRGEVEYYRGVMDLLE